MGTTDDKLKVWDLIVKGVFGAALTAAVMMYGYRMQDEQQKVREQNSQLQAAIELTSKQKDLDVELYAIGYKRTEQQMVKTLDRLGGDSKGPAKILAAGCG